MENQTESIFEPRNPLFLNFAKWLVIISSAIAMFIGVVGLTSASPQIGLALILGSIFNYFVGMVLVNMLFNIKDIKDQTKRTNDLLEMQIKLLEQDK